MQGAGNDFIRVETGDTDYNWSTASKMMCDRHYGIGADGLLLLMPSDIADFKMRIFNADGSESEICGNGLRCLVRYYIDHKDVTATTDIIRIETIAGIREARKISMNGVPSEIMVGMGQPGFDKSGIPVKIRQCEVDIKQLLVCKIAVAGNNFR